MSSHEDDDNDDNDFETLAYAMDLMDEFIDMFVVDDVERFVSTLNRAFKEKGKLVIDGPESELLYTSCRFSALKCAAAILDGQTPLEKIDLNTPDEYGCYALHCAAETADAPAIEFLLSRGARTDIRGRSFIFHQMLPLEISLELTCSCEDLKSWNRDQYLYERTSMSFCKQPKQQSVFLLVVILCLPRMQRRLWELRVLAWSTKETKELFLEFVRRGDVLKVAALLTAAHKKLMSKDVLSDAVKNATIPPIQQLFDVFERAGDAIDEYCNQWKDGKAIEPTVDFVAKLLEKSGFVFDPEDVDVTIYGWARIDMVREWESGKSERPYFLNPGERFDILRAEEPSIFGRSSDEKEDIMKIKIEERLTGDAWATFSSKVHNIWTRTRPSSRGMGSYDWRRLLTNFSSSMSSTKPNLPRPLTNSSSSMSSTKPKPPHASSLLSFSTKSRVPSLLSFLKGFGRRI